MILAQVVGNVWGTRQADNLQGYRLLLVRPLTARAATGSTDSAPITADHQPLEPRGQLVAVDQLGAGPGELVLVAHGSRCRDLTLGEAVPTKEVVVAIVDAAEVAAGGPR